jgi:hypothetical protein
MLYVSHSSLVKVHLAMRRIYHPVLGDKLSKSENLKLLGYDQVNSPSSKLASPGDLSWCNVLGAVCSC